MSYANENARSSQVPAAHAAPSVCARVDSKAASKRKSLEPEPAKAAPKAAFISPAAADKPAEQARGGGADMFTPRLISEQEKEKANAPPAKKLRVDKVDKTGMKPLTSFFKVKPK